MGGLHFRFHRLARTGVCWIWLESSLTVYANETQNNLQRADKSGSRLTFRSGGVPAHFLVDLDGEQYEANCESIGTLPEPQKGPNEDEFLF